ncbi:hypothetical protein Pelo_1037 [Pelomyxa schiedti]|nr:hypothetical protein Pelo_1037 [Pelomyxa schiedti]
MAKTTVRTELLVDSRAQFVALACATIVGRCGVSSPLRVLAGTPSVVSELGRSWIAGASRIMGCTVYLPSGHSPLDTLNRVHMFLGVSVTLGVVWCRFCGTGVEPVMSSPHCSLLLHGESAMIEGNAGNLGDDRFLGLSDEIGVCFLVDSCGRVLARLEGNVDKNAFRVLACNKKWVVMAWEHSLMLWNVMKLMSGGDTLPVCNGVKVECMFEIKGIGAKFPRFSDPCGDEIALMGEAKETVCLYFVDLQKSIEAGVSVVTRLYLVPHSGVLGDFVWDSPDTIVTLDRDRSAKSHDVYSTKTGILHSFPTSKYVSVVLLHPAHITAKLKNAECRNLYETTAVTEVFSTSDFERPSALIEAPGDALPVSNWGLFATLRAITEDTHIPLNCRITCTSRMLYNLSSNSIGVAMYNSSNSNNSILVVMEGKALCTIIINWNCQSQLLDAILIRFTTTLHTIFNNIQDDTSFDTSRNTSFQVTKFAIFTNMPDAATLGKSPPPRIRRPVAPFIPEKSGYVRVTSPSIGKGDGLRLGSLPNIVFRVNQCNQKKNHLLLALIHRVMFDRPGMKNDRRKNILNFSGFGDLPGTLSRKEEQLGRLSKKTLKEIRNILDLREQLHARKGEEEKKELITQILSFLRRPCDFGYPPLAEMLADKKSKKLGKMTKEEFDEAELDRQERKLLHKEHKKIHKQLKKLKEKQKRGKKSSSSSSTSSTDSDEKPKTKHRNKIVPPSPDIWSSSPFLPPTPSPGTSSYLNQTPPLSLMVSSSVSPMGPELFNAAPTSPFPKQLQLQIQALQQQLHFQQQQNRQITPSPSPASPATLSHETPQLFTSSPFGPHTPIPHVQTTYNEPIMSATMMGHKSGYIAPSNVINSL